MRAFHVRYAVAILGCAVGCARFTSTAADTPLDDGGTSTNDGGLSDGASSDGANSSPQSCPRSSPDSGLPTIFCDTFAPRTEIEGAWDEIHQADAGTLALGTSDSNTGALVAEIPFLPAGTTSDERLIKDVRIEQALRSSFRLQLGTAPANGDAELMGIYTAALADMSFGAIFIEVEPSRVALVAQQVPSLQLEQVMLPGLQDGAFHTITLDLRLTSSPQVTVTIDGANAQTLSLDGSLPAANFGPGQLQVSAGISYAEGVAGPLSVTISDVIIEGQ